MEKTLTAAEATEVSASDIDPNAVLYQIVGEDVLGVLESYNESREEDGKPPTVLSGDQIRKIGDDMCANWWEEVYDQIDDIARACEIEKGANS